MAAEGQPTRPPTNIEDFLWNLHSVLVATPAPLALDSLKDAYSKHLGHKFIIERFLVVGDGGLAATLKRIPHMVTLFTSEAGVLCVRATQAADTTRQKLLEADSAYRRELIKKNAAAKAKAGAAKAGLAAPKAAAPAAAPPAAAEQAPKAAAPPAAAVGDKRQPDGGDPEAKKQRTGSDEETLAKMLVQGVVRVLQNRVKTGKGPLPLSQLEDEFKQQWKLPFNPQQAGERDAVSFLQKWPNKVEVFHDGTQQIVQLAKNKPKASGTPEDVAANKAGDGATAKGGAAAAPAAVKAPAAKGPPPAKGAPPAQAAATNGPTRPPASVEDFLWNVHTVIDAHGGPMPVDQLKDAYSSRLGHKCAIERFLVVGEGGLAATLKRIPHVVTLDQVDGTAVLKATLPSGTTKEDLIAADHQYRRQLAQKNAAAAKAKAAAASAEKGPPPAKGAPPVQVPAPQAATLAPEGGVAASAARSRPASEPAAGERDAKKPRSDEQDTLARMLVQGVVRVLQNRVSEGRGPAPVASLEEEFKALWKVPFNLQQAGETDAVSFLRKWSNKVEVSKGPDGAFVVQLAKKGADKAKAGAAAAEAPPPAKAAAAAAAPLAAAAPAAAASAAAPAGAAAAAEAAAAEAQEMLTKMHHMVRRQEELVSTLRKLSAELKG